MWQTAPDHVPDREPLTVAVVPSSAFSLQAKPDLPKCGIGGTFFVRERAAYFRLFNVSFFCVRASKKNSPRVPVLSPHASCSLPYFSPLPPLLLLPPYLCHFGGERRRRCWRKKKWGGIGETVSVFWGLFVFSFCASVWRDIEAACRFRSFGVLLFGLRGIFHGTV